MIDCYTWMTDNGYKPRMMLEETGLAHRIIPINLRERAQMAPEFMKNQSRPQDTGHRRS